MEVYRRLANREKNSVNYKIFEKISLQENNHYNILKEKTNEDVNYSIITVQFKDLTAIFLGLTYS